MAVNRFVNAFVTVCIILFYAKTALGNEIPLEKNSAVYGEYRLQYVLNVAQKPYQAISAEEKAIVAETLGKITITPTAIYFELPPGESQPCTNISLFKAQLHNKEQLDPIYILPLASLGIKIDSATIQEIVPSSMVGKIDYQAQCQIGFVWVNNTYLLFFNPRANFLMVYTKK